MNDSGSKWSEYHTQHLWNQKDFKNNQLWFKKLTQSANTLPFLNIFKVQSKASIDLNEFKATKKSTETQTKLTQWTLFLHLGQTNSCYSKWKSSAKGNLCLSSPEFDQNMQATNLVVSRTVKIQIISYFEAIGIWIKPSLQFPNKAFYLEWSFKARFVEPVAFKLILKRGQTNCVFQKNFTLNNKNPVVPVEGKGFFGSIWPEFIDFLKVLDSFKLSIISRRQKTS